jgi:hypothetical protein
MPTPPRAPPHTYFENGFFPSPVICRGLVGYFRIYNVTDTSGIAASSPTLLFTFTFYQFIIPSCFNLLWYWKPPPPLVACCKE